jgi:hypothetical protein
VTTTTEAMHENTKEGRRDGTGGRRVGTPRKKWREGVHQVMCAREEREGVTGRTTGSSLFSGSLLRSLGVFSLSVVLCTCLSLFPSRSPALSALPTGVLHSTTPKSLAFSLLPSFVCRPLMHGFVLGKHSHPQKSIVPCQAACTCRGSLGRQHDAPVGHLAVSARSACAVHLIFEASWAVYGQCVHYQFIFSIGDIMPAPRIRGAWRASTSAM